MEVNAQGIRTKKKKKGFWKRNTGLAFVMPWPIGLLVLKSYPFAAFSIYSPYSYNSLKTAFSTGLESYKYILGDKLIIKVFIQTFKHAFLTVPLELMFALFIAYILNNKIRGLNFFRTIYYIPSILGGLVSIAVLWKFSLRTEGFVNIMLEALGIPAFNWLGNPDGAFFVIVFLRAWQSGSPMVILSAALKGVQGDLHEAVAIDGAGKWKQFFQITIPLIMPVILYNFVTQLCHKFQEFNGSLTVTQGGPLRSTTPVSLLVYNEAFKRNEMGLASAIVWLPFLVIMTFTAVAFISQKYWIYYADEDGRQAYEQKRKSTS